ncbi:MAG TPA: hypothetical protein VGL86_25345 [Polyangia bacterium]|jgi:hypothetical protein
MKLRTIVILAVLALAPALAHAQMPAWGLAVDARIGAGLLVGGTSAVIAVPSLTVGARLADRVQVGLGAGLYRISSPGGGPNGTNQTTFTFAPTVEVDLLRAHDRKAAWYLKGALPLGAEVTTPRDFFVVGYDAALGARYCPHPNFAVALEGGVTGLFLDPAGKNGFGVTTVYGALVGTFYWGK